MQNTHILELGTPSGNEYIGSTDMFDINELVATAEEKKEYFLYNQNQFADRFGYNMCTAYNAITNMSIFLGRRLTDDEIKTILTVRETRRFNPSKGGYQTDGTDSVGEWARALYPDKKIIWMMIDNKTDVRKKLFTKRIPLMTTYRGNQAYNDDTHDGHLDKLSYGVTTYGHAITDFYIGNSPSFERLDNYDNHYSIKTPEDFYTLMDNGIQGRYSWIYFSENQLNQRGQIRLKLMKLKITNGERPEDNMSRDEVAITVLRLNPNAKLFWNNLNGPKPVTRSEFQKMMEVGTGKKFPIQIYSESTKNNLIKRSEAWTLIASLLDIK